MMDLCPAVLRKGFFWRRDILRLLDFYKGIAVANIQNGPHLSPLGGYVAASHMPQFFFPELYSFAKIQHISIKWAKEVEGPKFLFHLPPSQIAYQQLLQLAQPLDSPSDSRFRYLVLHLGFSFLLFCQSL
jgi:hypothetical protein